MIEDAHVSSSRELIMTVYKAFNARDIPGVLAKMHADVDWPNGMEGGRVHGHGGVREYWERQWKMVDPHVEPMRIEDDESGRTVVTVQQVVRDLGGNVLFDRLVEHVYSIRDSLIQGMEIRETISGTSTQD
jgi:ketosteroid isomerase-like protein